MSWRALGSLPLLLALACQSGPPPALAHRLAGDDAYRKGEYAAAAAEYGLSLDADPRQLHVWETLAASRLRLGDTDGAAQALIRTLDLLPAAPQKAEVHRNVAGIYLQVRQRDQAEPHLIRALELVPQDESSLSWLAEIEAERGGARSAGAPADVEHLEKALGYYDRLTTLNPDNRTPWLHKRVVLSKYLAYLAVRKQAAEQALRGRKGDMTESANRLQQMEGKSLELRRDLAEVDRKLAELRRGPRS